MVEPIPERVTHMNDVNVGKMSRYVAVRVSRCVALKSDLGTVELEAPLRSECISGNCTRWRTCKSEVPTHHSGIRRKMFASVFVRQNPCTSFVHPHVSIRVIEVPVRVDQVLFDWISANGSKSVSYPWACAGITGVDN